MNLFLRHRFDTVTVEIATPWMAPAPLLAIRLEEIARGSRQ